jgi:acyl-CoA synthetase (AMP-forming)/AMP-acid ligase II
VALQLRTVVEDLLLRAPERVAIVDGDGEWTYAELSAATLSATARLRAAGVEPDDRVAVVDAPSRLVLASVFACMRLGATVTLINPRLTADEVATLGVLAGVADVAVAGAPYLDRLAKLPATGIGPELCEPGAGDPSPGQRDGEHAVVLFTSGTTGLPKPVPVPWATLSARLEPYVDSSLSQVRMLSVPTHHVGGLIGALVCFVGGHTLVMLPRFDAGEWLRLVEQHQVQMTFIVPTMLSRIVEHPDLATTDISSLQTVTYGASPMTDDLVAKLTVAMPGVGFVNTFGQTETLGGITLSTPADALHPVHRTSVGKLIAGVSILVVAPGTDEELPPGEVGELLVKSAQNVVDGWLRTGDLVRVDADGYLYPNGRLSDTINRGGEKFGPIEVEEALRAHPSVTDCAVAGVPDAELNERVGAVVVVSEPIAPDDLQQWCATRIAKFKTPELIVFADVVPLTDMSKVDRLAVIRIVQDHKS